MRRCLRRQQVGRRAHAAGFRICPRRIQPRQRHVAVGLIDIADDLAATALLQQPHAFPDEARASKRIVLGHSTADGVVVELRGLTGLMLGAGPSDGRDLRQPALVIPFEALIGVLAAELADQPTVTVVEVTLVFEDANQVVFDVAGLGVLGSCAERLLGGAIEDVAGRVVLEDLAVGCGRCVGSGCKRLSRRSLNPSRGVIAMRGIAIQAVAALAQFALTEKAFCLGRPAAV